MKVRLKLTRDEYKGLGTVASWLAGAPIETFRDLQYSDAMRGLVLRMLGKVPTLKREGNRMTLTDMEALALCYGLSMGVESLPPFEMALGYKLLGEIDRQKLAYLGAMRSNGVPALKQI